MCLTPRFAATLSLLAILLSTAHAASYAGKDIANENDGRNWLAYGRTYSEQHYSPLKQIDAANVSRLGLAWSLDLPDVHNGMTVPLEVDGVVYFTVDQSWVHAVDVRTGELLWKYDPEVYKVAGKKFRLSWGPRGIAYWKSKIYVGTLDGRLIALNAATGKPIWTKQTVPADDTANITGAPRVFNGKVIIGHGGADFGPIRGYVTAYDAENGKQLWRFYAVPGDPDKGFEDKAQEMAAKTWSGEYWKLGGGGTIWNSITYDPELNRLYLGTGNGQPHEWQQRSPGGGDNLFLCSIVAVDADTGKYLWHYQTNPRNSWDYNSDMDITTATLQIDGKPRKVLMHAPKNGFLYVIDRENGKLISAEKIDYVTWASHIDLSSGQPVENPDVRSGKAELWPSAAGAHSVMTQAYSPLTQLLYIPTIRSGNGAFGAAFGDKTPLADVPDRDTTRLQAWNPVTQKQVWSVRTPGYWNGGVLSTAGNLVFEGMGDGTFHAYDAQSGKPLWAFDARFGISGAPITYEVDGKQYVSVIAGWGGTGAAASGQMTYRYGWQARIHTQRLLTFQLDAKAVLPPQPPPSVALPLDAPEFKIDPARAKAGAGVYFRSLCLGCHGFVMIAGGYAPDLRASPVPLNAAAFRSIVKDGALLSRGMPKFDDLSDDDLESLRHYIRQRARETLTSATGQPAAVDAKRLLAADDPANNGQWMSYGRDYAETRFSPLKSINTDTVKSLGLAWFADFDTRRGQESTPLVVDGVIYVTTAWSKIYAFEARSGKQLWQFDPKVPGEWAVNACCDVVNRGVAAWKGRLYLGTIDGRLIAVDARTGEPVWDIFTIDKGQRYAITGAPRVVKGLVLIGSGGAEFSVRGYISAYDAETGKLVWRWYTVPGSPDKPYENAQMAMAAKTWGRDALRKTGGGGTPWDGITYDPKTDLLYVGTGNGGPWPAEIRDPKGKGDHLFLSSIVALKVETGEYVWHYQEVQRDSWDYTAVQQITVADLKIDGRERHVIMQAPKDGYFYVLDAASGELLSATPIVPLNWSKGIDKRTGRPIMNPAARYDVTGKGFIQVPSFAGAHNWHPMSYSPLTGLVYIPAMEISYPFVLSREDDNPMGQKLNISFARSAAMQQAPGALHVNKGFLLAWDPVAQKEVWRVPHADGRSGGALSTAGGLVFAGDSKEQEFAAYRADTGEKLWSQAAQTGVLAGPSTFEVDGEQYVAVVAGYRITGNYWAPNYSRLLVYKLGATARLPDPAPVPESVLNPPPAFGTPELIRQGQQVYGHLCGTCHGNQGFSRGMFPDLRYAGAINDPAAFKAIVVDGALTANGMVSFAKALKAGEPEAIRAYLVVKAIELKQSGSAPMGGAAAPVTHAQ